MMEYLVLGYEIRLSATNKSGHIHCNKCVSLTGSYPNSYEWNGWHDGCLCYKIPILMDDEMMAKYQKLVATGLDTPEAVKELQKNVRINDLPECYINFFKK